MEAQLNKIASAAMIGATVLSASAGTVATKRAMKGLWYPMLGKANVQPPSKAFAPVWTALYGAITWSGMRLLSRPASSARTAALGLWAAQMVLNAAWSPSFFAAKKPRWALADVALLWGTIAAYVVVSYKVDRAASVGFLPYLAWVSFASYLNEEVVRKNPVLAR